MYRANVLALLASMAAGWVLWSSGNGGLAQTPPPPSLPAGVEDVLKLTRNGLSEDVVLAQIRNSGASYDLSVGQIIYLHEQGVSQTVIQALIQSKAAPAAAPVPVAQATPPAPASAPISPAPPGPAPPPGAPVAVQPPPPPPEPQVNLEYFRAQLAPYGTWVQVGPYGWCWRPDRALAANPDWRPYYDMGRWVYTENGWFWESDYGWGDIPFHYGRWVLEPGYGWLWVPDYTWGPAWVFWRHAETDGCIGWAPLPLGAVFVEGGWWEFRGRRVAVDFDFGLGEGVFVFVGYDHFHDGFFRLRAREYAFHLRQERIHEFYHRTALRNEFRRDEHGRFVNQGLGRERIERLTRHKVEVARFEERRPVGNRDKLAEQRREELAKQRPQPAGKTTGQRAEAGGRPAAPAATQATVNKVFKPAPAPQARPAPQPQPAQPRATPKK